MNKEIAKVLRDRLEAEGGLPFIEKYAGLVQTVIEDVETEGGTIRKNKFPVATEVNINGACMQHEEVMSPDSSVKGIVYFEDNGTQSLGRMGTRFQFQSTLTLVCWINRGKIVSNIYDEITGIAIQEMMQKLDVDGNPENVSMFTGLTVTVTRIAPQEAAIFSRYTYDETVMQYLRPPFEFFAFVLQVKFGIRPDCVNSLEIINQEICY